MKIFIFGASGLVGNAVFLSLKNKGYEVHGSSTSDSSIFTKFNYLDALNSNLIEDVVKKNDLIINAAIINSKKINEYNYFDVIKVNSLFPKAINYFADLYGKKLINISSDAVFSGKVDLLKHSNESFPDGSDEYAISKILGEVKGHCSVNVRSSFLGYNKNIKSGLIFNLHMKKGKKVIVNDAYWHGSTTHQFAEFIEILIKNKNIYDSLFNFNNFNFFPNNPVKLYTLFKTVNQIFNLNLKMVKSKAKHPSRIFVNDVLKILDYPFLNFEESLIKLGENN